MKREAERTLISKNHVLAETQKQLDFLNNIKKDGTHFLKFKDKLSETQLHPLKVKNSIDVFQINLGKMCNQVCKHCHVDAGPDRKEIMTKEVMQHCLNVLKSSNINTVDLTGGAPEMNPNFKWFVEEIKKMDKHIIVRCNLTIILAGRRYAYLPDFFKQHQIEIVSSLPHFSALRTNAQRGNGVFEKSIKALEMLNDLGYGKEKTGLILNLVYNPSGAFLPSSQEDLEKEFKEKLSKRFNIEFNALFAITNLPISRYLTYLEASGNYEDYMDQLIEAYNPHAAANVMCRNTISVSWDGYMYDCDFNQMLDLKVNVAPYHQHIKNFDIQALSSRNIIVDQHCFGCTAGAGSSCGGSTA